MARPHRTREPAFGSDSFLDVIANLVGIVLIIIVMVGARIRELPAPDADAVPPDSADVEIAPRVENPEIAQLQTELDELERRLQAFLASCALTRASLDTDARVLGSLRADIDAAKQKANAMEFDATTQRLAIQALDKDAHQLRFRVESLRDAVAKLTADPAVMRALRYHQPVSRTVAGGELFFECQRGRVTFVDLQSMLDQLRKQAKESGDALKNQWQATGSVDAAGPFRLKYTLQRIRETTMDPGIPGLGPNPNTSFGYRLSSWVLVPLDSDRGETAEQALQRGSTLRRVVDSVPPDQVVLTFWVYPDSFELFRSLRDYLFERGFTVAARPLPAGELMGGSPAGTASRGQ